MLNKKPGMDVMIAVGKPKPPMGLKGAPGAPDAPDMADDQDQPEDDKESQILECVHRMEACLKKIAEAVGVDTTDESDTSADDSGAPPSDDESGYGK